MTREREIIRRVGQVQFTRHRSPENARTYAALALEELLRLLDDLKGDIEDKRDREARQ